MLHGTRKDNAAIVAGASKRSLPSVVRRTLVLAALLMPLGLSVLYPSGQAAAGDTGGGFAGQFSVVPAESGTGLSYFRLRLSPGGEATETIAVVGESRTAVTLSVFPTVGVTSPNSGDAYEGEPTQRCRSVGCWLGELPRTFTLGYHTKRIVSFHVTVPEHAAAGQYLAGVAVQRATTESASASTSKSKRPAARSVLVSEVVVGVAVTVGSGYPHDLAIRSVSGARIGNDAALIVHEADTGSAFEHPKGAVTLQESGRRRQFVATSSTVLPGGQAGIRVLARGVSPGRYAASAYLHYDNGQKIAHWSGTITIPGAGAQPISVAPGSRLVADPAAGVPITLAVLLPLAMIVAGATAWYVWARRTRKLALVAAARAPRGDTLN